MGHKMDISSSNSSSHSHHHRSRSSSKTHRSITEPSMHSLSSSDISSEASSVVHKRSTPKIAAAIIAAVIVIAGLVGLTVYFVGTDRRSDDANLTVVEQSNKVTLPDTALDYQTYHDETASVVQQSRINPDQLRNHRYTSDNRPMPPYRNGKDPEGPEEGEEDQPQLVVEGDGGDLSSQFYKTEKMDGLFGDADFSETHEETGKPDDHNTHQYGSRLDIPPSSNRRTDDQDFKPVRQRRPGQPRPHRQGIVAEGDLQVSDEGSSDLPPNSSSRGGVHIPVSNEEVVTSGMNAGLSTLDRRPGRPAFHHMGPQRYGPPRRRRPDQILNRRMGMEGEENEEENKPTLSPIEEAKLILSNFDSFISVAESEAAVLKDMAKNITDGGKEVNLHEILTAVNETIKDNPDSAIARLMNRFYNTYLMEEEMESNEASPVVPRGVQEKSLSSLLFLSFGIFLLNSVNDVIAKRGGEEGRRFQDSAEDNAALKTLMANHAELVDIFQSNETNSTDPSTSGSPISGLPDSLKLAAGSNRSVNGFLKLLMNLMNAYNSEKESEVDCVWSLYCHQLNRQASLGGMLSSVARINSVGMRLVLNEIPPSSALKKVVKSVVNWKDMPCEQMFPKCFNADGNNTTVEVTETTTTNNGTDATY